MFFVFNSPTISSCHAGRTPSSSNTNLDSEVDSISAVSEFTALELIKWTMFEESLPAVRLESFLATGSLCATGEIRF